MKIAKKYIDWAIEHISTCGDTDVFPYPIELSFLKDRKAEVSGELANWDAMQHHPLSLVESLVPKTRFGFRTAHQAFLPDLVYFTSAVLSLAEKIEAGRDSASSRRAFSYRLLPLGSPELFDTKRKYKDWLEYIQGVLWFSTEYTHVVITDISDFYSRIYRHRLENIVESITGDAKTTKVIEQSLADWRSRQSFGIPVGSNASRILAEAALNDTDLALSSEGYEFTRYVDDIMLFVKDGQDPYAALAFLANHLAINEGLALNNQKTKVLSWEEFRQKFDEKSGEDEDAAHDAALEMLFWAAYGEDTADPDALARLMLIDLQKELEAALDESVWDMGKIRILLKALRLTGDERAAEYVRANAEALIPFAKDLVLFIESFVKNGSRAFDGFSGDLVRIILSTRLRPLDCSRAWLLELGARGIIQFTPSQVRELDQLSGSLDVRQLHIIRWKQGDVNYFRSRKSRLDELNYWTQPTFIYGAMCLPRDEYRAWIGSIRSRLNFPLSQLFIKWCLEQKGV
jgi:hypothetical protein